MVSGVGHGAQKYAPWKECVSNVHGVREAFFDAGRAASVAGFTGVSDPSTGRHAQCYFVSKQLWAKGYRLLFGLMEKYRKAMVRALVSSFFYQTRPWGRGVPVGGSWAGFMGQSMFECR